MKTPNRDKPNYNKKNMERVEKALKDAYHREAHKNIEIGDAWRQGVMVHVRQLGAAQAQQEEKESQETDLRLMWRFAGAASAVALLLLVYAAGTGVAPEYNLVQMLVADPTSLATWQLVIP